MKYYDLNPGQLADWIEAEKRGQSTLQENLSEQVKESVQYWLQTTESNKMRDPLQITGDDAAGTQALSDTVDANIADREDASTTNVQCTKAQELPKFLEPDVTADYTIFAETVMQDEATRLTVEPRDTSYCTTADMSRKLPMPKQMQVQHLTAKVLLTQLRRKRKKLVLAQTSVVTSHSSPQTAHVPPSMDDDHSIFPLIHWRSQESMSVKLRALALVISYLHCVVQDNILSYAHICRLFHDAFKLSFNYSNIRKWHGARWSSLNVDSTTRDCRLYDHHREQSLRSNLRKWHDHWLYDLSTNGDVFVDDQYRSVAASNDHHEQFQIVLSALCSGVCRQTLDNNISHEVVCLQLNSPMLTYSCQVLNSTFSRVTNDTGEAGIVLNLTGELLGAHETCLRSDWSALFEKCHECADTFKIIDLVQFVSHREEDEAWTHGISPSIPVGSEKERVAQRFVMSNARLLGPNLRQNGLTLPRFVLEAKMGVLGVNLPGRHVSPLRTGLAFVTTTEGRTYCVLSDNGRIVGNEDDGIDWKCRDILSCDAKGERSEHIPTAY